MGYLRSYIGIFYKKVITFPKTEQVNRIDRIDPKIPSPRRTKTGQKSGVGIIHPSIYGKRHRVKAV